MLSTVSGNIKRHNLISPGQTLIVAVSGGADSVALLHVLYRLRHRLRFYIHVASLNHGIRGEAAARDVQHVRELAGQWQLPFTAGRVNAPGIAKRAGIGLEDAARRARYDFLAKLALQQNATCVAVGHHAVDQIETILLHIIRGSGMRGLRGMRMSSPMPTYANMTLVRPLLNVTRNEIEAYCVDNRLTFRHDSSNDDTRHLRNFLRHRIARPLLERNPHLVKSVERLAAVAEADNDYLESRFTGDVLPLVERREGSWRISKSNYQSCHDAMKRRLLREAFRSFQDGKGELSFDSTQEIIDWVKGAAVGKRRDLGTGIQLRVGYDSLYIERKDAKQTFEGYRLVASDIQLPLKARDDISVGTLRVALLQCELSEGCSTSIRVPVGAEVQLRTRRKGERFRPKGMSGKSRKIKDWMIDRKIPRQIRDRIPLVSVDDVVIAVCVGNTWHLAETPWSELAPRQFNTLFLE